MSEIDIAGQEYACGKLAIRAQLHVARRLSPLLGHLAPMMAQAVNGGGELAISPVAALAALSETVRELSDADLDYILDHCLECVRFRQGERWAPLRAPNGMMMLQAADDLAVQLRLVWEVLSESLANFSLGTLLPFPIATTTTAGAA